MTYSNNPRSITGGSGITVTYNPSSSTGSGGIQISSTGANLTDYGMFYSTVTQPSAGTTAANIATYDTIGPSNGISVTSGSRITFSKGGTYGISINSQVSITSGGPGTFNVWLAQNGVNLPGSNNVEVISGGGNSDVLVNSFIVVIVNPGDYIQVVWSCTSSNGILEATGTQTNPIRPTAPSILATVNQLA